MEESQLPIDLSFTRLADWLVSRKRIPADWRKRLIPVRAKIAAALPALPRELHPSFLNLTPEDVGYLEAKHILDVLTADRPEARTLFGKITGIGGDWDIIVRAYEKDHLFLGESAQIMLQIVNYEIPFFKKQLAKFQQQLADVERKENEFKRSAAAAAIKYQQACRDLGIEGTNVKAELIATTNNLSHVFRDVEEALCNDLMTQTVNCYQDFISYAYKQSDRVDRVVPSLKRLQEVQLNPVTVEKAGSEADESGELPSTTVEATASDTMKPMNNDSAKVVCEKGVTSGSQESSQAKSLDVLDREGSGGVDTVEILDRETSGGVDFDSGLADKELMEENGGQSVAVEADHGTSIIDESFETLGHGGIDWDTGDVGDASLEIQWDSENHENLDKDSSGIDWDISVEDIADNAKVAPSVCSEAHTSYSEGIVASISSRFLETEFRNCILDDLLELKAFLTLKIEEAKKEETASLQHQVQALLPQNIQQYGIDSFEGMSTAVFKAIGLLVDKKIHNLIMIATSKGFLKRLEESLLQKRQQESKLLANLKELAQKKLELRNMLSATWPKQESAIRRVREMKDLCERTISALYEGRQINIIGEINSVLGQSQ